MSEKQPKGKGSVQKCSIIRRKWFVWEHVTHGRRQRGTQYVHRQVDSLSLGLTLKPPELLPDPIAIWVVP